MRVAIITNKAPMHKYLCAQISNTHEVVAVLHPSPHRPSFISRIHSIGKKLKKHGTASLVLQKLGGSGRLTLGWDPQKSLARAQECYFNDVQTLYDQRVSQLAHDIRDINSTEAIHLLDEVQADVVICLGGPIYRKPLIKAAKLMLNYHTGISPIYNGSGTIYWSFANNHIHLSGGTLMIMSEVVDGGMILAHYLCPIKADDDPGTLFMKAIIGGATLYDRFLQHLSQHGAYTGVSQSKPFYYCRGFDWTVYQTLAVQRNIELGLCRSLERPEQIIEYWRLDSPDAARQALKDNIARWICDLQ